MFLASICRLPKLQQYRLTFKDGDMEIVVIGRSQGKPSSGWRSINASERAALKRAVKNLSDLSDSSATVMAAFPIQWEEIPGLTKGLGNKGT